MPFKDTNRVLYEKNPLIEVVCQLRFPRILSINENMPAVFQDRIRDEFPLFEVTTEHQQQFSIDATDEDVVPVPKIIQADKIKNYKFSTDDNVWHVNLTSTFIALSTSKYRSWEEFRKRMIKPLSALIEIYSPAFFERVGLRYVDAFSREKLNLEGVAWNRLIQPFALGFLSNPDICDEIKGHSCSVELDIGMGAVARINTILGFVGDPQTGLNSKELCFIVDSDLFSMKKQISELDNALNYLHSNSTKLIRSVITEELHAAMEPKAI